MDEHSKFNRWNENIRKYQTEVTTELKNILKGFNSRMDKVEAQLNELEDKAMENTQNREFFFLICVPEEERRKGPEKLFEEIMAENFPNLVKEADIQVKEAPREFQIR
ncbi:Hypothetical predicted protein [Lynx pardinus]|uniref:Uncharacterized protein n=1 Tax=Lynx pardinus TaxID=191816 RepID=A0A485NAL0_LYNPA|nr:Hypothetical predicted protein [Lynx pardinus]